MNILARFWKMLRVTFLEGLLYRTEGGQRLRFFSRRSSGANMMFGGFVLFLIVLVWVAERVHFELNALSAKSDVLEVQERERPDGSAVYQLTLRWTHEDGNTYVATPRARASYDNVPLGSVLDIKYDPDDPKDVRIETPAGPWTRPAGLLIGGILSFVLGRLLRGNPNA